MGWCEECCFDVVFVVEFEKTINSYIGAVDTSRDVCWVLSTAVCCVDPVRYCVNVDCVTASVMINMSEDK